MTTDGYNGYANYETWVTDLWLSNDEAEYRACCDMVEEAGSIADGAQRLKEYLEESLDASEAYTKAGLFTDLLQHAIGVIDWYEIADSFKPDTWGARDA